MKKTNTKVINVQFPEFPELIAYRVFCRRKGWTFMKQLMRIIIEGAVKEMNADALTKPDNDDAA